MNGARDDRAIIGDGGNGAPRVLERLVSSHVGACIFAALVYVPLLFTDPRKVEADTKSYLYLDPGRLLTRAVSLWDPKIAMGTLSHQTIGYIFLLTQRYPSFADE